VSQAFRTESFGCYSARMREGTRRALRGPEAVLFCAFVGASCTQSNKAVFRADADATLSDKDASLGMDAELGSDASRHHGVVDAAHDGMVDAALDGSVDLDAGWALCRVPSREACNIGTTKAVRFGSAVCTGDTPVACTYLGPRDGAASPPPVCVGAAEDCSRYNSMTFAYECDDTADCPIGEYCLSSQQPAFREGARCVPDCVDHRFWGSSSGSRGVWQACTQDCECGPRSTCDESSGGCTIPYWSPMTPPRPGP